MNHNHGRILFHSMQFLYWNARAVTGEYRSRIKHRGVEKHDPRYEEISKQAVIGVQEKNIPFREYEGGILFRPLTDEELLKDTLDIMQRHLDIVRDTLEHLELL